MKGCSQGELGRCPAASPAFALLSKGTQEANQVHLVFTDSMSTYTDRISVLSSLRCLAAASPRHFHKQKKQHWTKQVSFCQESALSWLIEKSKPSFKGTGEKETIFISLSFQVTPQNQCFDYSPSLQSQTWRSKWGPQKGNTKLFYQCFYK